MIPPHIDDDPVSKLFPCAAKTERTACDTGDPELPSPVSVPAPVLVPLNVVPPLTYEYQVVLLDGPEGGLYDLVTYRGCDRDEAEKHYAWLVEDPAHHGIGEWYARMRRRLVGPFEDVERHG